jgi:HSP20 family protein
MRYRRMHVRYAVVLGTGQPRPVGEAWGAISRGPIVAQPVWRPRADVSETADSVRIIVELAGVLTEEVEVLLYEDAVVVHGTRRPAGPDEAGVYNLAEIPHGPFRVEIPLSTTIDPEQAEARYDRGLLELALRKDTGDVDGR